MSEVTGLRHIKGFKYWEVHSPFIPGGFTTIKADSRKEAIQRVENVNFGFSYEIREIKVVHEFNP